MPRSPEAADTADTGVAASAGCAAFLHALWGDAAQVVALPAPPAGADATARAVLGTDAASQRILQLPDAPGADSPRRWHQAAAAHAAAHWRFGGDAQPRAGLKPVQQALLGVLEDARVEARALLELPGLRSLWLPFHTGQGSLQGAHAEALLARLSHCLLDPAHPDPHPWIARARTLFFAPDGCSPALRSVAEVRRTASLLGNDLGQMRLPFNAPTYRVHAAYRDDNHHLWLHEPELPPSDTPLAAASAGASLAAQDEDREIPAEPAAEAGPSVGTGAAGGTCVAYAEWDHRIGRYRPAWCRVFERDMPPALVAAGAVTRDAPATPPRSHALAGALARLRGPLPRFAGRASRGEEFHAAALVEARIQQRLRQVPDTRIYRRRTWPSVPLAVVLLLDASASTAAPATGGGTLLRRLSDAALAVAAALEANGHASTLLAFASFGRARVELQCIKDWGDPAQSQAVGDRLQALRSGGSTRLGTVLRHAAARAAGLRAGPGVHRRVLLLTDGEAHDVDVSDPAYLAADQRRAVAEAASGGVGIGCLVAASAAHPCLPAAMRGFDGFRSASFRHGGELPGLLPALLR